MSLWLWTTQPNHIKKKLPLKSNAWLCNLEQSSCTGATWEKELLLPPLGQWTAAATKGLSCLLSSTMSVNFLPYTSTSFYSPDFSLFSSLGLQLVRACACVCVLARACACLCACAYWKCCGQKRFPSLCVWWIQDRKTRRAWQQEKTEAGRQTPRCGQTQVVIIITRKKQLQWLHSAKQAPWLKQLVPALRQPQVGVVLTLLNTLMASFFVLIKLNSESGLEFMWMRHNDTSVALYAFPLHMYVYIHIHTFEKTVWRVQSETRWWTNYRHYIIIVMTKQAVGVYQQVQVDWQCKLVFLAKQHTHTHTCTHESVRIKTSHFAMSIQEKCVTFTIFFFAIQAAEFGANWRDFDGFIAAAR